MSRRIRFLAFALIASFALGTAACADVTAPDTECGVQHSDVCLQQAGVQHSGV